jgi:hypothetical protein
MMKLEFLQGFSARGCVNDLPSPIQQRGSAPMALVGFVETGVVLLSSSRLLTEIDYKSLPPVPWGP